MGQVKKNGTETGARVTTGTRALSPDACAQPPTPGTGPRRDRARPSGQRRPRASIAATPGRRPSSSLRTGAADRSARRSPGQGATIADQTSRHAHDERTPTRPPVNGLTIDARPAARVLDAALVAWLSASRTGAGAGTLPPLVDLPEPMGGPARHPELVIMAGVAGSVAAALIRPGRCCASCSWTPAKSAELRGSRCRSSRPATSGSSPAPASPDAHLDRPVLLACRALRARHGRLRRGRRPRGAGAGSRRSPGHGRRAPAGGVAGAGGRLPAGSASESAGSTRSSTTPRGTPSRRR